MLVVDYYIGLSGRPGLTVGFARRCRHLIKCSFAVLNSEEWIHGAKSGRKYQHSNYNAIQVLSSRICCTCWMSADKSVQEFDLSMENCLD